MTELYERIGCFGYFGVGSGFALVSELHNRAPAHCEACCPLREECHTRHHKRIISIAQREQPVFHEAPESSLSAIAEAMCERLVAANFVDGANLAALGTVTWRGEDTMPVSLPTRGTA